MSFRRTDAPEMPIQPCASPGSSASLSTPFAYGIQLVNLLLNAIRDDDVRLLTELTDSVPAHAVNVAIRNGLSMLHYCAFANAEHCASFLFERYPSSMDVNVKSPTSLTALHIACDKDCESMVRLLLRHGARVDETESEGFTPLMLAAREGSVSVLPLMLRAGADPTRANGRSWTSLMLAAENGRDACLTLLIDELLRSRGFEFTQTFIQAVEARGWAALHFSSQDGHLGCMRILIERGANVHAVTEERATALHLAAQNGHCAAAVLLVDAGASVEATLEDGTTPLLLAVRGDLQRTVRSLLQLGAAVDRPNRQGWAALHFAAKLGHVEVARVLLAHGALPNVAGEGGWTPAFFAAQEGNGEILRCLVESSAGRAILFARLHGGCTLLHIAAQFDRPALVDLLIDMGLSVRDRCSNGALPLHYGAYHGAGSACQRLLSRGAPLNARSNDGQTALHYAASENALSVLEILLQSEGILDVMSMRADDGNTAFDVAVEKGHHVAADALRLRGDLGAACVRLDDASARVTDMNNNDMRMVVARRGNQSAADEYEVPEMDYDAYERVLQRHRIC